MRQQIRVFKLTDDDWYPSHFLGDYYMGQKPMTVKLVEVSFLELMDGCFRVCVWGNDDLGMEQDYAKSEFLEAEKMFHRVIAQNRVNKDKLEEWGFVYC